MGDGFLFYPISNKIFELTLSHKPGSSRKQPLYPKGVDIPSSFGLFWTMDFLALC